MTIIDRHEAREVAAEFAARRATPRMWEQVEEMLAQRAFPRTWYLLCRSDEISRRGVVPKEFLGNAIVLFRTEEGKLHALAGHCAHMGANLAGGTVQGNCLRCPLHHWMYDGSGECRTRNQEVRQRTWPVEERFGCVFIFHGEEARCELPRFDTEEEGDLQTAAGETVNIACPWLAISSNAFDMQHLNAVHERALREPPDVMLLDRFRLRLCYISRVTGKGISDRITKWLSGDRVHVSITCWGGTMFTVESRLGRFRSMLLLGIMPVAGRESGVGGVEVRPVVAMKRTRVPGWNWIRVKMALWMFTRFLEKDMGSLQGMRFKMPETFLAADAAMRRYFEFVDQLPVGPAGAEFETGVRERL